MMHDDLTIVKKSKLRWYGCNVKIKLHGKDNPARYSNRDKKNRTTEEEVGRQHQGVERTGIWPVSAGHGKQG